MKLKFPKESDGTWFLHTTDANWDATYVGYSLELQHLRLNSKAVIRI